MLWKKAIQELPEEKEEVLIRKLAEYHLAVYSSIEKMFILRDGSKLPVSEDVMWTKLVTP
jgi:hypothetical protein